MNALQKEDGNEREGIEKQLTTIKQKRNHYKEQVQQTKDEIDDLKKEREELQNIITRLGNKLKQKVPSQEFNALKETIDTWNLERFMHHKELEESWNHYAGKK